MEGPHRADTDPHVVSDTLVCPVLEIVEVDEFSLFSWYFFEAFSQFRVDLLVMSDILWILIRFREVISLGIRIVASRGVSVLVLQLLADIINRFPPSEKGEPDGKFFFRKLVKLSEQLHPDLLDNFFLILVNPFGTTILVQHLQDMFSDDGRVHHNQFFKSYLVSATTKYQNGILFFSNIRSFYQRRDLRERLFKISILSII